MTLAEALQATQWILECKATCLAELRAELARTMASPVPRIDEVRRIRARIERVERWVPKLEVAR